MSAEHKHIMGHALSAHYAMPIIIKSGLEWKEFAGDKLLSNYISRRRRGARCT